MGATEDAASGRAARPGDMALHSVGSSRRALVLGLARSGEAAALALARRGVRVVGVDRNEELDAGRLREHGVEVVLGAEDPALVDDVDLLIKSPGVPDEVPLVAAARARGVAVWSEVELGARILANPLLGVTGTNGKTTTSELLGEIFRAAGRPVTVAGNVGRPLTGLDGAVAEEAWIVCELSSFQLQDIDELRPRVGVLLNLTPDHLDRHADLDAYRAAKLRIFENQGPDDVAVVPRGFPAVPGDGRRVEFAPDDPLPAEPRIPGAHNRENAAAATA
ncbi:MAG: Mur ligase family protein, partial [Gaiellaceae bacterium]